MSAKHEIQNEKQTIFIMIGIYCRKNNHTYDGKKLCTKCQGLLNYAYLRIEKCPFWPSKGACQRCPIHCYKKDMRMAIKKVMAFSGPRMIIENPLYAFKHMLTKNRKFINTTTSS